jgi:hypothetical protein
VVLVGDRRAEEGHDAVAGELIDRALVAMHGAGEELEAAVHDRVDGLWIEALRERAEPHDIGEEHRDLLALALERAAGGEDLLREVRWGVGLRRPESRLGSRGRRRHQRGRTASAEPAAGRVHVPARRTHHVQGRGTGVTEACAVRVLVLALGAGDHGSRERVASRRPVPRSGRMRPFTPLHRNGSPPGAVFYCSARAFRDGQRTGTTVRSAGPRRGGSGSRARDLLSLDRQPVPEPRKPQPEDTVAATKPQATDGHRRTASR